MPRIKKTSTTETVESPVDDKPNVTPEPAEGKVVAAETTADAAVAGGDALGKVFQAGNPCDLIVEDERGAYALTCASHEAAVKACRNIGARLRAYSRVGSPYEVGGVYVSGAIYIHIPSGKPMTAEAVLLIRTPTRDIEIPMTSLDTAQKRAEQCHIAMSTGKPFELSLENGEHVIFRALAISAREV